mmetsp:Transcript_11890/g.29097  ORF Transcript_11890/g.29097 Transcript_11890/m.29097 type:complete len:256 (-) Transcript_11890:11-778(-)
MPSKESWSSDPEMPRSCKNVSYAPRTFSHILLLGRKCMTVRILRFRRTVCFTYLLSPMTPTSSLPTINFSVRPQSSGSTSMPADAVHSPSAPYSPHSSSRTRVDRNESSRPLLPPLPLLWPLTEPPFLLQGNTPSDVQSILFDTRRRIPALWGTMPCFKHRAFFTGSALAPRCWPDAAAFSKPTSFTDTRFPVRSVVILRGIHPSFSSHLETFPPRLRAPPGAFARRSTGFDRGMPSLYLSLMLSSRRSAGDSSP